MKEIEARVLKYLKDRGWDKLSPSDLAKSIMIESAELLEHFQWGSFSLEDVKNDKEKMDGVKKELADVLIYCIEMSVLLGLDTKSIIFDKLAHVEKKYPAELMKKNAKKDTGSGKNKEYWNIKKEYRKR